MLDWLEPFRFILATIFVLGIVVFVHELGHFLAAKATGVYAPRFSIGFGKALWRKRWGETEYILAAFPLGGYVRMASSEDETMALIEGGGEKPAAKPETVGGSGVRVAAEGAMGDAKPRDWDPNALAPFGPLPVPDNRLFESKSLTARLLIMISGVVMNVALGFLVYTGLSAFYGERILRTRVIGNVRESASVPEIASRLAVGDTILAIDGAPVATWNDVMVALDSGRADPIEIRTHRAVVTVPPGDDGRARRRDLMRMVDPLLPPVIDHLEEGKPAERAGLRAGDSIVAVNGTTVTGWGEVVRAIQASPERPLELTIARGGEVLAISVTPNRHEQKDPLTNEKRIIGRVGAGGRVPEEVRPISLGQALVVGWRETWQTAGSVVDVLRKLVTGGMSADQLGGPIAIARASGEAARLGLAQLLNLTALLSINVAIFNLLPIPILDGGQILINLLQAAKGSAFSARTREYIMRFGLAVIILIFALAMFNDLRRVVGDIIGWLS